MHNYTEDENTLNKGLQAGDIVYPIALIAYLIIGFRWGLWHPGWLVFTIAWAIEEIAGFIKAGTKHTEFYGLASVVFFVLGFFFDLWQYAWIAFVVAAVIEAVITSRRAELHEEY